MFVKVLQDILRDIQEILRLVLKENKKLKQELNLLHENHKQVNGINRFLKKEIERLRAMKEERSNAIADSLDFYVPIANGDKNE